ncbi:translation initiation factor IF-2 [Candidatus Synechococcus calcipolaris G9]|uniref:Translation initiation factor IF-2 n=1 Tax=Candidatus Synechococcus calcipolaris G9 TaxID=1497997 RepID=A0ABT6EWT8_9SYNE|nr:translation initiation factor IF-2 [Candidatus Synechococcus calcipolaris]MDG2990241.1 translation initiation factor IF-2 [Candidatus Synechococcus calcipolaris G9]
MSSGKVRIYDLSKELSLDNRDLLAICEQLGVAYKSHSSTISDDDAERIRQSAQTYQPVKDPKSPQPPQRNKPAPPVKSGKKGQQIVAIHTQSRAGSGKRQKSESSELPDSPESAPSLQQPPSRQATASPAPQSPEASPETAATSEKESKKEIEATPPTLIAPPALPTPGPERTKAADRSQTTDKTNTNKTNKVDSAPIEETRPPEPPQKKPTLAGPPTRPQKPTSSVPPPKKVAAEANRGPVHSQDRIEIVRPPSRPSKPESGAVKPLPKPRLPELQPPPTKPPEADRPAARTKPGADGDAIEVLQDESVNRVLSTRGRRNRGKSAQEEEEVKVSKVNPRNKRRETAVEDDDDLELSSKLAGVGDVAIDVSQSLQRPPKAKTQRAPRPVTAVSKPEKSSEKRSSRGRDRRTEEVAPTSPEMITLDGSLSVQELAAKLVVAESEVIKVLFFKGIAATINQTLDLETAQLVADELGILVETTTQESAARKVTEMLASSDLEHLQRRPPVVTIMGHVDHGKTSLLDAIRNAKVAQGEAGGITQHIGAYHVDVEHNGENHQVVFLDTPGHEAFTAMRARGARVTDIAILVVAADDGVQPQTIEAISHAKAAEVPIIVAINKIDKESAQPDRVKQELTEFALVPEEWGGDTIMVPVSALEQQNLDTLLEMILLVSEVEDLYANPDRAAKGTVIEAHLDKARGPVATLLVQNGTLQIGDVLVAGSSFGRVRAMIDDRGEQVKQAAPSFAVEVLGLSDVPAAGDDFEVFIDEKVGRATADQRAMEQRESRLTQALTSRRVSLTSLSDQAREGELKELNLVIKADVQGSLEAILASLNQLPQDQVQLRILLAAPGEITETDVDLAAASSAVIIGFNTTLATGSRQAADQNNVDVREYNIIYKLLDDLEGAMEGLLEPELVEEDIGQAEVRAVFPLSKGSVAGCYVQSGKLVRNCKVRILRKNQVVYTGVLSSLKRIKDDVKEVAAGYECGIRMDDFQGWQEGDLISAFQTVAKRRTLNPSSSSQK